MSTDTDTPKRPAHRPLQRPEMGPKRRRVVYVPDALWGRVTAKAAAEGVSASEALTRLLEAEEGA